MALERYLSAHLYLESAHMLQLEKSGGKIVCPDTILYKAIALYQLGDLLEANTHFQALMGIDG